MIGILLVAVSIVIYWIFKYDDWYPNEVSHDPIANDTDDVYSTSDSSVPGDGSGTATTL